MKTFTTVLKKTQSRYLPVMTLYVLATVITATGLVVMNRLSGEMSEAALNENTDTLMGLLLLITGVMVVRAVFSAISAILLAYFSANTGYALRLYFVRHFLRVPFKRIEQTAGGENLSIYTNDIPKAQRLVASGIFELVSDFISFVSAFIFLFIISPRFTGISLIAAAGMLVLQLLLALPLQRWGVRMSEKQAAFNAVVNDSLQNLSVVAAYNLEELLERRYLDVYGLYFAALKKFAVSLSVMVGSMMAILMSPLIVIFTVLALAVIGGELTLAEFIAFVTTVFIAAGSVMMLAQNVGRLATDSAGAKRFNENTNDTHEETDKNDNLVYEQPLQTDYTITFRDVSFTYKAEEKEEPPPPKPKKGFSIRFGAGPEEDKPKQTTQETFTKEKIEIKPALNGVRFTIKPGSRVAIVGGSGSGKSTVLKLLLGLYEPTKGTITLGESDITTLPKSRLRDVFAYVPQDSFLFPESIGKNITLTDETNVDMTRLTKACEQAGILDFIQSLPNCFDGVLTEAADNISGGQRQRIALARAFYKDAPVILFDEATASLDPGTEAGILNALNSLPSGKTVIMVAHRPLAIAACDTVIVMAEGKITGIGNHRDLLLTNETYQQLNRESVLLQAEGKTAGEVL
jgi:ABC-type multidrug transport system fused ATPase/permease subunit